MESIEARNEFNCPQNLSSFQCVILCLIFEQLVSSFRFIFGPRPPPTYEKKKSQQLPLWGVTLKATTRRRHVAKSPLAQELPQDEKPTEVASAGDAQQSIPSSNHIPFPET